MKQNMNLDQDGLPMQKDGTKNDQLARTAMIAVGEKLSDNSLLPVSPVYAMTTFHQTSPGVYSRFKGDNPRNTGADQLLPVFAAYLINDRTRELKTLIFAMFKRIGFAQNNLKVVNGVEKWKVPDFLILRALPLVVRMSKWLKPFAYLADLMLLLSVLATIFPLTYKRSRIFPRTKKEDDIDDNNLVVMLAVIAAKSPTPISRFATRLYADGRQQNLGCRGYDAAKSKMIEDMYHPVVGILRWHHRGGTGGNPQIADLFAPVIKKYILEVK